MHQMTTRICTDIHGCQAMNPHDFGDRMIISLTHHELDICAFHCASVTPQSHQCGRQQQYVQIFKAKLKEVSWFHSLVSNMCMV